MESQRRTIFGIMAVGALLVLIAVFSKSWFTASHSEGEGSSRITSSVNVGPTGGQRCVNSECQSVSLGQVDDNWSYAGIACVLAGLVTIAAAGYVVFLIARNRTDKIDPKRLAMPAGAGAAVSAVFLFIKPTSMDAKISWAGFIAIAGFGASAGAIFLTQRWLGGQQPGWRPQPAGGPPNYPPQYTQPSYPPQPQGGYPQQGGYHQPQQQPQQGYAPPQQPATYQGGYAPPQAPPGGYAPPQPQGGYASGSEPPVQRIQPLMPGQRSAPQSQPPMAPMQSPGSQPPVPMMQKQSTTIPPGTNPCPRCGTGLAYSSNHGKWYCARCQQYV